MSSNPQPRFKPEPFETSTRSSRRFTPQPIETTNRSSRGPSTDADTTTTKRRFLPQPIETTTRNSKEPRETQAPVVTPKKSRFTPQLVESSTRSSRDGPHVAAIDTVVKGPETKVEEAILISSPQPRRKFVPELLETATRSRRAPEAKKAPVPARVTRERLEATHLHSPITVEPRLKSPLALATPALSTKDCRRLGIPLPARQLSTDSLTSRSHCFRVPDLEPIESSESEEEVDPSRQPSPSSSSDLSDRSYNHVTRRRESVDKGSSRYLLELAAKAAERQLREQALAAYPNDDRHTYVDHFIGDVSAQTSAAPSRANSVANFRRESSGFFRTDLQYRDMQRHQQQLEAQRDKEKQEKARRLRRLNGQASGSTPWSNPYAKMSSPGPDRFGNTPSEDGELERMRSRARPPMLGKDLKFPRCPSPDPARFDVTQGSFTLRSQMCYLTEQSQDSSQEKSGSGLWSAKRSSPSVQCSTWSRASSQSPSTGGLWGGFCHESTALPTCVQTGLLTPRPDEEGGDSPFKPNRDNSIGGQLRYNRSSPAMLHQLPPSPPPSNSGMVRVDEKLELEQAIEEEFDDAFITQVYNYLSLGYPSLARRYDEELGKIAKVPVADLRQDDYITTSRGYIRLGDDEIAKEQGISGENCARWKALRSYVREWARQQPMMTQGQGHGQQAAIRRGSWAW